MTQAQFPAATVAELGTTSLDTIDEVLGNIDIPKAARTAAQEARSAHADLVAALTTSGGKTPAARIAAINADPNWSTEGKKVARDAIMAEMESGAHDAAGRLTEALNTLDSHLAAASYPARPATADSGQEMLARQAIEMQIANVKDGSSAAERLAQITETALQRGDALTAHVASGHWASDLLAAHYPDFEGGEGVRLGQLDSVLTHQPGSVGAAQIARRGVGGKSMVALRALAAVTPATVNSVKRRALTGAQR